MTASEHVSVTPWQHIDATTPCQHDNMLQQTQHVSMTACLQASMAQGPHVTVQGSLVAWQHFRHDNVGMT